MKIINGKAYFDADVDFLETHDPDPLRWLSPAGRAIAEAETARRKALITDFVRRRDWADAARAAVQARDSQSLRALVAAISV